MSSGNGDQQQQPTNRRIDDEDVDDHNNSSGGGGGSRSRSPPAAPRGAAVPSFLKRNVIDENTGISFGCGGPDANVPGATRRVGVGGGGISFATFPSAAAPSFASPATMGPTVSALASKAAASFSSATAAATAAFSEQQDDDDDEGSWKLASVPTLPEFHPLERTATFVANAADKPSVVSSRISRVLRDRSIEATYDSSKAKVRCVSMDGVDFRIRLYRGRAPQYGHGIIVEVQRRFGMSFTFHHDTQAVLDAAHGRPTSGIPAPSTSANGAAPLPLVSDSEDLGLDSEQDSSAASTSPPLPSTSSMAMVATMFGHPGYDSHYLAYQTLIPLTSAARMGRATAKSVANQLLQPGNPVGAKVLDAILHAPVAPPPPSSNKTSTRGSLEDDSDDEDEDESGHHHDDELATKLQTMAWTVLSNAVHATKGQAVGGALREELRPALLRALDGAAANPRRAQMAALCAEFLCLDDPMEDDVLEALERAVQVGRAKHAGLKAQAQRCLDRARRM